MLKYARWTFSPWSFCFLESLSIRLEIFQLWLVHTEESHVCSENSYNFWCLLSPSTNNPLWLYYEWALGWVRHKDNFVFIPYASTYILTLMPQRSRSFLVLLTFSILIIIHWIAIVTKWLLRLTFEYYERKIIFNGFYLFLFLAFHLKHLNKRY